MSMKLFLNIVDLYENNLKENESVKPYMIDIYKDYERLVTKENNIFVETQLSASQLTKRIKNISDEESWGTGATRLINFLDDVENREKMTIIKNGKKEEIDLKELEEEGYEITPVDQLKELIVKYGNMRGKSGKDIIVVKDFEGKPYIILGDIYKSKRYGSSGGGTKTSYQESAVCLYGATLALNPSFKDPMETLEWMKDNKSSIEKNTEIDQKIEEIFDFIENDSSWRIMTFGQAQRLVKEFNLNSNYEFHRGSEITNTIRKLGKKLSKVKSADLWNPSDIYIFEKGTLDEEDFSIYSDVHVLNSYLGDLTDENKLFMISLKAGEGENLIKKSEKEIPAFKKINLLPEIKEERDVDGVKKLVGGNGRITKSSHIIYDDAVMTVRVTKAGGWGAPEGLLFLGTHQQGRVSAYQINGILKANHVKSYDDDSYWKFDDETYPGFDKIVKIKNKDVTEISLNMNSQAVKEMISLYKTCSRYDTKRLGIDSLKRNIKMIVEDKFSYEVNKKNSPLDNKKKRKLYVEDVKKYVTTKIKVWRWISSLIQAPIEQKDFTNEQVRENMEMIYRISAALNDMSPEYYTLN